MWGSAEASDVPGAVRMMAGRGLGRRQRCSSEGPAAKEIPSGEDVQEM